MTADVLVFRHVPHEHLGRLGAIFGERGLTYEYAALGQSWTEPRIESRAGLVVMGGPMNVDEVDVHPQLADEVTVIREALERGVPTLGICLGSQLIAKALGAQVFANPRGKEIGWFPLRLATDAQYDLLLRHFAPGESVLHWHGDVFELPDGAVALASSALTPIQAFRWGDRAWGLLFHVEIGTSELNEWLSDAAMRDEATAAGALAAVTTGVGEHEVRLTQLAARTLGAFADLVASRRGVTPTG